MRVPSSSLQGGATAGRVVTLMAKDVHAFDMALIFANDIWVGVVQLVIIATIMYMHIGVSSFVGLAALFLILPLQSESTLILTYTILIVQS